MVLLQILTQNVLQLLPLMVSVHVYYAVQVVYQTLQLIPLYTVNVIHKMVIVSIQITTALVTFTKRTVHNTVRNSFYLNVDISRRRGTQF